MNINFIAANYSDLMQLQKLKVHH